MMLYLSKQRENLTITFTLEYVPRNVSGPVHIFTAGGLAVISYTSVLELLDSNVDRNNGYHNRGSP
jgi:hypothetical protein